VTTKDSLIFHRLKLNSKFLKLLFAIPDNSINKYKTAIEIQLSNTVSKNHLLIYAKRFFIITEFQ